MTSKSYIDRFHHNVYFNDSLKFAYSVKEIEKRAADELQAVLKQIPALKMKTLKTQKRGADILIRVDVSGQQYRLVCEVKSSGQPRHIRETIYQLRGDIAELGKPATPILIAPFLSSASRDLCTQSGVNILVKSRIRAV
jgi:hypothetical protein